MRTRRTCLALTLAAGLLATACRRHEPPGPAAGRPEPGNDRAVVSLELVDAKRAPSESAPTALALARGAEVRITGTRDGFFEVSANGQTGLFIPSGSLERLSEKEAREKRTAQVVGFTAQPGRAMESCPVFLAPDFGAARWGVVEDGQDVEVLLADHDFYGVRLAGGLAFVPARSIRLLPAELTLPTRAETKSIADLSIQPVSTPQATGPDLPEVAANPEIAAPAPLEALPPGAAEPELVTKVEPRYPEIARRMGWEGEVVLKAVVETDGRVDRVTVVSGGKPGMTEAAAEAVSKWIYKPARVEGRPVAVYKVFRIQFSLKGN